MPARGTCQRPGCSRERCPLSLSPDGDSAECGLRWGEGQASILSGILQRWVRPQTEPVQLTCNHFPLSLMGLIAKTNHHGVICVPASPTGWGPLTEVLPSGLLTDARDRCHAWGFPWVSNTEKRQNAQVYAGFPKGLLFGACTPSLGDKVSEAEKSSVHPSSFGKWLTAQALLPGLTGFTSFLYQFAAV